MKKNLFKSIAVIASVAAVGLLTACGGGSEATATTAAPAAQTEAKAEAETKAETAAAEEKTEEKGTITVAASPTPHAEILA